jgi:hypothetical protein
MNHETLSIKQLSPELKNDFYRVHSTANGHDFCYCSAWWVKGWKDFDQRTADDNRAVREELFADNRMDGYLLYRNDEPVGWVQACGRDLITKLTKQFRRRADRKCAAITCWFLIPSARKKGYGHTFLAMILEDLRQREYATVEAFPIKWKEKVVDDDVWTGPIEIYIKAGFFVEKDHESYPVYRYNLIAK